MRVFVPAVKPLAVIQLEQAFELDVPREAGRLVVRRCWILLIPQLVHHLTLNQRSRNEVILMQVAFHQIERL